MGAFSADPGASACTPAPAGSFVGTTGATAATECAMGAFSADPGASACTPAPAGSFVGTTGATAPTECAVGSYSPDPGAASCLPAPVDTYVDSTGATAPIACPAGTYTVGTGSTSEADCLALAPTIKSISPASGPVGKTVTIKGTNLSGAITVSFGKKAAAIVSDTRHQNKGQGAERGQERKDQSGDAGGNCRRARPRSR